MLRLRIIGSLGFMLWTGGCAVGSAAPNAPADGSFRREAFDCLRVAIQYRHNPVVRAEAVEAFESEGSPEAKPWIRTALVDEHAGVRFAACLAVGMTRDTGAELGVRKCLSDRDASVQLGAMFAMHRLGDWAHSSQISSYLLEHQDIAVRRNAALVLGRMEEPSAVKMLARVMNDADPGLRHHALEAMARLGNAEAKQELVFLSNSGVGSDEVFAIQALAALREPLFTDTFRYKLETAIHLETRLAAARGLGLLGSPDGFDVALGALNADRAPRVDAQDPPQEQILRIRLLAAAALGATKDRRAMPQLAAVMKKSRDPRFQVAAGRAILEVLHSAEGSAAGAVADIKD